MPPTNDESFGVLPWLIFLLFVLIALIAYVIATR
jgi:hypothetical protein